MSTCDAHDGFVVIYEGWGACPVCRLEADNRDTTAKAEEQKGEIEELKGQIKDLQDQNNELEVWKEEHVRD